MPITRDDAIILKKTTEKMILTQKRKAISPMSNRENLVSDLCKKMTMSP